MKLLFVLFALVVALAPIVCFIAVPIWALVHCATAARDKKSKTLWIIGMLVTWPVGGLVYAVAASGHRVLRWAGGTSLVIVALFIGVLIWGIPVLIQATADEADGLIARVGGVEILPEQRAQVTAQLEALRREVEATGLREYDRVKRASALMRLLDVYARDNKLTPEECADWASKYESRALIDPEALEQQIRQIDVMPRTPTVE